MDNYTSYMYDYLDQVDKFKINKELYSLFEQSVANKMDVLFRDYFKEHYDEFKNQMIENRAIVSGSSILQTILDETWENSDIDIYIPILDIPTTMTDANNPKTKLEDFLYDVLNYNMTHSISTSSYIVGNKSPIKTIREYVKKNEGDTKKRKIDETIIQTILIDIEPNIKNILEFIHSNYDFDICKNIFYYDDDGCHICIYKAEHIINKHTDFHFSNITFDPLKRYQKYKDRGFTFSNSETEIIDMINKRN